METAKIRRAGYPVRHSYREFVERYRYLCAGITYNNKTDFREAAKKICNQALQSNPDYQFGHTKIFLKDSQDQLLEAERSRIYLKYILVLQRGFRRVIFKRWIAKYRKAAVTFQKHFRARGYRKNYLIMRNGFRRLQVVIESRQRVHTFMMMRRSITAIQAQCRGYLTRKNLKGKIAEKSRKLQEFMVIRRKEEQEYKKAGHSDWKEVAEANYHARVSALLKEMKLEKEEEDSRIKNGHKIYIEEDNKVVDDMFSFLPPEQPTSPEPVPKHKNAYGVSNLLSYFERRHRNKKTIPKKLLSHPVTSYQFE